MPTQTLRSFSWTIALLTIAIAAPAQDSHAQDLHIKKSISSGGYEISKTETSIQGPRQRDVTQSPTGNSITLRQCDLRRTVTINEQAQTYYVVPDAPDEAAVRAAALMSGAPVASSGGYITETSTVTDTGDRKTYFGYPARHLKIAVTIEPSKNACSQQAMKYEVDGWYSDISKDQSAACGQSLPPVRQAEGCTDRVIRKRSGSAKPGYPIDETIQFHSADGTTTDLRVHATEISKQALEKELFDIPAGYREVKSLAELNNVPVPQVAQQPVAPAPVAAAATSMTAAAASDPNAAKPKKGHGLFGMGGMAKQIATQQAQSAATGGGGGGAAAAMMSGAGGLQGMASMMGTGGAKAPAAQAAPAAMAAPAPQVLGPKAAGKIRIGIAPPDAQVGQGNNAGADNSTPIRNAVVALMSGPAVEIAALDAHIPMQLQAEAQQKQCDYIMYSAVSVKHSAGSSFGKFMKVAGPVANMTPMGMMAHGLGGAMAMQTAGMAAQAAAQAAQQQAMSQLAGFNHEIKSKDDVTVQYQLVQTGQTTPVVQNALQGKAKTDGEDVLTPLLQQAATNVLTEVSKK